jgi:hypothetical protein
VICGAGEEPAGDLLGANCDETITYPPFFAQHVPWLQEPSTLAHQHGKLLTHTDGENQGLLPCTQAGFDIADRLPAPMTKVTLAEAIEELQASPSGKGSCPRC